MKPFATNAPCANWVEITNIEARANSRRFVRNARKLTVKHTLWSRIVEWMSQPL